MAISWVAGGPEKNDQKRTIKQIEQARQPGLRLLTRVPHAETKV
ncbi:hypothetical protein [Planctopirus hydrillae]|nr:hypothetical protein [Planctopirus hydrillae]